MRKELAEHQYGYGPGKSDDALNKVFGFGKWTESGAKYAVLVASDIKNAFNSANYWKGCAARPTSPHAHDSVITQCRSIIVEGSEFPVTSGVPLDSFPGKLIFKVSEMKL